MAEENKNLTPTPEPLENAKHEPIDGGQGVEVGQSPKESSDNPESLEDTKQESVSGEHNSEGDNQAPESPSDAESESSDVNENGGEDDHDEEEEESEDDDSNSDEMAEEDSKRKEEISEKEHNISDTKKEISSLETSGKDEAAEVLKKKIKDASSLSGSEKKVAEKEANKEYLEAIRVRDEKVVELKRALKSEEDRLKKLKEEDAKAFVDPSKIGSEEAFDRRSQERDYKRGLDNAKRAKEMSGNGSENDNLENANSRQIEKDDAGRDERSDEAKSKLAGKKNITRDDARAAKYGYRDNWTKYLNKNYYDRMKAVGKRQAAGYAAREMDKASKEAYQKKQGDEIKSASGSAKLMEDGGMNKISNSDNKESSSSKLESVASQVAAKAALNAAKAIPAVRAASMIPGVEKMMENIAGHAMQKAAEDLKDKIKKRLTMQALGCVGGCVFNPIVWIFVLAICVLAILIGLFQSFWG